MNEREKLELIHTLRAGYCKHVTRVNICTECCERIERIVAQVPTKE